MGDTDRVARLFQKVLESAMSIIVKQRLQASVSRAMVVEEHAMSVPWSDVALPTFVESPSPWSITLANGVVLSWGGQNLEAPDFLRSLLSKQSE